MFTQVEADKRLTVSAEEVAAMLGISPRHWWGLNAQGRTPEPIRLGRRSVWALAEIRNWIEAGCPPRDREQAVARA